MSLVKSQQGRWGDDFFSRRRPEKNPPGPEATALGGFHQNLMI